MSQHVSRRLQPNMRISPKEDVIQSIISTGSPTTRVDLSNVAWTGDADRPPYGARDRGFLRFGINASVSLGGFDEGRRGHLNPDHPAAAITCLPLKCTALLITLSDIRAIL